MARQKTRRSQGFSVYPRKDGRWGWAVTVDYDPVTGNPRRIQGICKTQKEASEKAIASVAKVKSGAHVDRGRDKTVGEWLDEWLETYIRPHREPKTTSYYEGMIRIHLKPELGRVPLRKLTPAIVQRLLNGKAKPVAIKNDDGTESIRSLSPETVRGIRATLRSALTQAYRNSLVAENVVQRVTSPRQKQKTPEFLTADEAQKLLGVAKDTPLEGLITLALHTGLRVGEATGLTWAYVDFDRRTIRVMQQLQRIEGKLTLKSVKSIRANRSLYLTQSAIEALQAERVKRMLSGQPNAMDLVFLNPEGRPMDPKYVDTHLKLLMTKAGLTPMSFHKLRHTVATTAVASGVPLSTVRDQLGHSQIALTANTYSHAVPTAMRDAAEALERSFTANQRRAESDR